MQEQEERKSRKRNTHPDRISLKPEVLARLNDWLASVEKDMHGIRVTRSELVNWLLMRLPGELSADEREAIGKTFFKSLQFHNWVGKRLKEAEARGENFDYGRFIQEVIKPRRRPAASVRRKTTRSGMSGDSPPNVPSGDEVSSKS